MDPNSPSPNQQPQSPPSQPVGQTTQPQPPIQPQYPQSQPAAPYGPPKSGNKRMMIGLIVGVIAILVIGGVAFALLGKKKSPSTPTTTSSSSNSTSSSSATTTSKTACELFTLSDAQAILGSSASTVASSGPTQSGSISTSVCDYGGTGNNIEGINIILNVSSKSTGATAAFEASQSADTSATPVSGIGDKAFYASDINTLGVLKGDIVFTVLVSPKEDSNTQSQATQVAQQILSNL